MKTDRFKRWQKEQKVKKVVFLEEGAKEVLVKSLQKGPWLINYRLEEDKILYLLWAAKGLDFLKNWVRE